MVKEKTAEELNELLKIKRQKLADFQAAGKDPFKVTKYEVQTTQPI